MGRSILQMATSIQIVYPQGVAWRKSPSYNDRITNVAGPSQMSQLQGTIVQGDVQYIQVTMPPGSPFQFQYIPMKAPNGQELARMMAPPSAPAPPSYAPPPSQFVQQPTQFVQPQPTQYVQPMQQAVQQPQVQYVAAPGMQQQQQVLYNDINRVQQSYGQQPGYSSYGGGGVMYANKKDMKKMKKKGCGGGGYGGGYGGGHHGGGHHGGHHGHHC